MDSLSNNRALLIGVGADLPNTVTDAQGLASVLTDPSRCRYDKPNVTVLTERTATRARVLAALDALATTAVAESTVIVYYSGHGYRVESPTGESYYLMPHGYDLSRLYQTGISGREFADKLAAIPAARLLLVLDCCHAGGLTEGQTKAVGLTLTKAPLPPEAETLFGKGRGRILIASSKADEYSLAGQPYSLFTRALIDSFAGQGVARQDGYVRALDLALYAREKVPLWSRNRQTPIAEVEAADNFIVAYYAAGAKAPRPLDLPPVDADEIVRLNPVPATGTHYTATVTGDGAIAQGPGAQAVGKHGLVVGGDLNGSVNTGVIRTGGGAYIGGSVNIGRGKFIGRDDHTVISTPPTVAREQLLARVQALRAAVAQAAFEADERAAIGSDLALIEAQLACPQPKPALLRSRLNSLKAVVESAAGIGEARAQLLSLLHPLSQAAQQGFR